MVWWDWLAAASRVWASCTHNISIILPQPPTPNQQAIAKHLEAHPSVSKVLYPGLPSHPQYALAQKQQHGPGAMITFYIKGNLGNARKFLENLKIFILAESLGAGAGGLWLYVGGGWVCGLGFG